MMPPSASKEHLIREAEYPLWGLTGFEIDEGNSTRLSEKVWTFLNSRLFNTIIIAVVLIEGLIIFAELLIDLDIIQDPSWSRTVVSNCTNQPSTLLNISKSVESGNESVSPHLLRLKANLSQTSFVLLTLFLIEMILRLSIGKLHFLVQPLEVFDFILVLIAFFLQKKHLPFFHDSPLSTPSSQVSSSSSSPSSSSSLSSPTQSDHEAALLIILFRLWRVCKLIQSIIDESQQKLLQLLTICEKEKSHAEHKIDILILKVEDLEHEVAYLKEKLKKTEKESSLVIAQLSSVVNKRQTAKRTESTQSNSSSGTSNCPCQRVGLMQPILVPDDEDDDDDEHDDDGGGAVVVSGQSSPLNESKELSKSNHTQHNHNMFSIVTIETRREPKKASSASSSTTVTSGAHYMTTATATLTTTTTCSANHSCNTDSGYSSTANSLNEYAKALANDITVNVLKTVHFSDPLRSLDY